jgi:triacylglycerol esterase/lipase EstA (alpha/beta hydrolase family)
VYEVRIDWSNPRERRVKDLEKGIDCILHQTGVKKAHLFALSIGGIDSRKLIFDSRNEEPSK